MARCTATRIRTGGRCAARVESVERIDARRAAAHSTRADSRRRAVAGVVGDVDAAARGDAAAAAFRRLGGRTATGSVRLPPPPPARAPRAA